MVHEVKCEIKNKRRKKEEATVGKIFEKTKHSQKQVWQRLKQN